GAGTVAGGSVTGGRVTTGAGTVVAGAALTVVVGGMVTSTSTSGAVTSGTASGAGASAATATSATGAVGAAAASIWLLAAGGVLSELMSWGTATAPPAATARVTTRPAVQPRKPMLRLVPVYISPHSHIRKHLGVSGMRK